MDRQAVTALLLALSLLSTGCGAQWTDLYLPGLDVNQIFTGADCDKNRELTHREAQSFRVRQKFTAQSRRLYQDEFEQADADGSGGLSLGELKALFAEKSLVLGAWTNQCPIQPSPIAPPASHSARNPLQ